jgi:hypothetical protein
MSQYTKWPKSTGGGGGGGGTVTSINIVSGSPSVLGITGSPITTSGTITESLLNQGGNTFLASPANGSTGQPTFRALVAADFPGGIGTGTVTSVAITTPNILNVSGSPITSSGTLALTLATQAANTVFAGPTSGGAATPTFRALINTDIPQTLTASYITNFQATVSVNTDVAANTAARHDAVTIGTANGLSVNGVQVLSLQAADATHTGALTFTDWNTFNNKQPLLTVGDITTSTTGVTIGNGVGSTVGPNVTVNIQTASGSQPGLLSSTDWNTFNNKQPAGSYITSLTGDVVAAGPGAAASTIQPNVVTNAKLAQMPANTIKGNNTGGTANAADLTVAQVNTMLGAVTTMGAFGSTPNNNGASISGNTLTLQPADSTHGGGVSTGTQTFAGSKTFGVAAADQMTIGIVGSTAVNKINGGMIVTTRTITANLTIDTTTADYLIFCNQSGAISVTLPTPVNGRILIIKDISGTANTNNITLVRHAAEKIEGIAASKILQSNFGCWTFTTDGTDWWMI